MMKSTGACMLAATVWPTSTLREMTMPSIGAVIDGVAQVDLGLAERGPRLRHLRLRRLRATRRPAAVATRADSSSLAGRSCCAAQRLGAALLDAARRRARPAPARRRPAAAAAWPAPARPALWKQRRLEPGDDLPLAHLRVEVGLQRLRWCRTPGVPTWTVVTASSVPVAFTFSTTSPRVTGAVVSAGAAISAAAIEGRQRDRGGQQRGQDAEGCVVSWR